MIVHHDKPQFVYYAPSKTGTTSISRLMQDFGCIFTLRFKHDVAIPNPKTLDYFFFITARNPFSRLVSIYRYAQYREKWQNAHQERVHELIKTLSFVEFVDKFIINGTELMQHPDPDDATATYSYLLTSQARYLEAMPRQDLIIRLESFDEDVRKLPFGIPSNFMIPHVNGTIHKPWQAYYEGSGADKMIGAVVTNYAKDFELLGYPTEIK